MRTSGILMSITSLPSKYGIGTLGEEAYKFVEFLVDAKQTYWQILPIGPTSYGDSPYQTFSAFAGNPYYIDLDMLINDDLLNEDDLLKFDFEGNDEVVDYEKIYNQRIDILKIAFSKFDINNKKFIKFKIKNYYWLKSYSLFMSLKYIHDGLSWSMWDDKYKDYKNIDRYINEINDVEFWNFIQFKFFEQWFKLKKYANKKGIKFIGDMAIYVAYDSADVWEYPNNYLLDDNLNMIKVAGCPPDDFSEEGQLWGNPIYDWSYMGKTGYEFWVKRVKQANNLFDLTRIDHFRGFAGYYCIDASELTAKNGEWCVGPGIDLFNTIKKELGEVPIIAEDLGFITPDVIKLLEHTNFPGMKLITFAFGSDMYNEHLPHNYDENIVCYAGTHDNPPILGWKEYISKKELKVCLKYLKIKKKNLVWGMIEAMFKSKANYVIVTMQDVLELGNDARTNTPSTLGGNWVWRMKDISLIKEASKLRLLSDEYNRN
ncbi:MAG: 4-alpha-glucanotransferase [bacterium]